MEVRSKLVMLGLTSNSSLQFTAVWGRNSTSTCLQKYVYIVSVYMCVCIYKYTAQKPRRGGVRKTALRSPLRLLARTHFYSRGWFLQSLFQAKRTCAPSACCQEDSLRRNVGKRTGLWAAKCITMQQWILPPPLRFFAPTAWKHTRKHRAPTGKKLEVIRLYKLPSRVCCWAPFIWELMACS